MAPRVAVSNLIGQFKSAIVQEAGIEWCPYARGGLYRGGLYREVPMLLFNVNFHCNHHVLEIKILHVCTVTSLN